MTAPSAATDVNLAYDYDPSILSQTIAPSSSFTTWDAFFSNTDATNCPITSCTISSAGNCGANDFTGTDHVIFDAASPWGITAMKDTEGYENNVCVGCTISTGGTHSIQIDNWNIKQLA